MSAVPPCFLTLSPLTQTTREHLRRMALLYSPLTLSAFRFQSYLPLVPLKRAFSILPFSLADFQMYSSFSTPFATIHHKHKKSFCQAKKWTGSSDSFYIHSFFTGEVFFPLPFNQSHNSIMFRLRALAFHTNSRYKTLARKFFTLLLLSRFPGSWINASPPFSYNFLYNGYLRRHSPYTVTGSLRPCTWFPFHLFCAVSIDALNSSMELY